MYHVAVPFLNFANHSRTCGKKLVRTGYKDQLRLKHEAQRLPTRFKPLVRLGTAWSGARSVEGSTET